MSKINLSFTATPTSDNFFYRKIDVFFDYGNGEISLYEYLGTNRKYQFFWDENNLYQSLINYAAAINRDYHDMGGNNNINAQVVNYNQVEITAKKGNFLSASETSDFLSVNFRIDNDVIESTPISLDIVKKNNGNCNTIVYVLNCSGGTPPYRLLNSSVVVENSWDGSELSVNLNRGNVAVIAIEDSNGETVTKRLIVPKKIVASEFTVVQKELNGASDVTVNSNNPIHGTTPIMYSINGVDYQFENSFPSLLEGTYNLRIRDVYGCEVEKIIVVKSYVDPTVEVNYNHLYVSNFNSISYAPCTSYNANNKRNYENTLSYNEAVGLPKKAIHQFVDNDIDGFGIGTQFQSSYPFNIATLFNSDGTKVDLPIIMIQENLGGKESVDCKLIPVKNGVGIYFDGGNEYFYGTNTILNASEHQRYLPEWAVLNQTIELNSLGQKKITGFGYDSDLDRNYFIVEGSIYTPYEDVVLVKYDKHPYNLFEFYLQPISVKGLAYISIESGYSFNQITKRMVSEKIEIIKDTKDTLLIEWSGHKNIGDMVFVSGIKGVMRVKGRLRPYAKSEAEIAETDIGSYPLLQSSKMGQKLYVPMLTPKLWDKLNDVSGISVGGTLKINGLELVRNSPIEVEEIGDTNYSEVTIKFDYSNTNLAIQGDEIVLNVSTGLTGKGNSTSETLELPVYDGLTRLVDVNGNFISVGGYYISV